MQTLSKTLTVTTTESQSLPAGLDVGNGATKLVLPSAEVLIPSYILPIHTLKADPELGLIAYLEGDRNDLVNWRCIIENDVEPR